MEAVPRLPMLSCELKVSPSNTDFNSVLKKYIRDHYHEDPESYKKEIKELETLRQSACKIPRDFTGCSILKRYYSQLHFLQSRFPMTDEGASCVPFMWSDIYSGMVYNITDIKYEQACILYNIGALHSQLGALDSRGNAEGMKIACTHFQCATWAFQHLRDTYPQPKGCDMSHDLLTFFINVLLAQAQECILEKSMLDSRKSSITAKVAAQVVDYYRCALGVLVAGSPNSETGSILDIVGSKTFKGWKKFIEFKMAYYSSISHLYMGIQAEEQQKMGERVAWLQSAFEKLNEAIKLSKSLDRDDLNEALTFTMDVIGGKHSSAKKENEFVYHEKVPLAENLIEVKGASLVKGIPFSTTDKDVCGEDIFARLVPMETHEASSLYSEEKAMILRSVTAKVEDKDQELMTYMSSLQLDKSMLNKDCEKIPQELLEKCAAMSVRPDAVSNIVELMKDLIDVSEDVGISLKMSHDLLTEEEIKEKNHQEAFGKRAPSMIIVELNKECSKYQEAHEKALDSNQTLQKAINLHLNNLKMLISPLDDLMKILPSVSASDSPTNENLMEELQHLLDKVDEMRHQRHLLEKQLRESLQNDDITKLLVTQDKKENIQKIFVEELKKHDQLLFYMDQNLAAQDNILCALTQANARYADTRKVTAEILKQRETMVNDLINSYDAYEELLLKVQKGLEFYQKLQTNVSRLLARIRSVTHVQDDERTQIVEAQARKGSRQPTGKHLHQESFAPKLKDYLPYMTNQSALLPSASGVLSENVTSLSEIHHSSVTSEPYLNFTHHIRDIPSTITSEVDDQQKSSLISGKQRLELSSEKKKDYIPVGIRPTPVGSEQTYTTAICTPLVSSVKNNSINKAISFSDSEFRIHSAISDGQWNSTNVVKGLTDDYLGIYQPSHFPLGTATSVTTTIPSIGDSSIEGIKTNISNQLPTQVSGTFVTNPNYTEINTEYQFPKVGVENYTLTQDTLYQINTPHISSSTYNAPPLSLTSNTVYNQSEQGYINYAVQAPSLECFRNSTTEYGSSSTVPYNSAANALQNTQSYASPSVVYPSYSNYDQIIPPAMSATTVAFNSAQFLSTQTSTLSDPISISAQPSSNVTTLNSTCSQIFQTIPVSGTSLSWSSKSLTQPTVRSAECQSHWPYSTPLSPNPSPLQNFPDQWNISMNIVEFPYQQLEIQAEKAETVKCIASKDNIRHTHGENKNISNSLSQSDTSEKLCAVIKLEETISNNQQQNLSSGNNLNSTSSQNKTWSANKDLLSSNTEGIQQQPNPEVLQPLKLEVKSLEVKEKDQYHLTKDPLDDTSSRAKFVAEVEKYEKFVEGLVKKSLNGTTPLDQKWKELADTQDKECRKMSISIARCYPLKNRFPDIMPYDGNRVKLSMVRDDYINASYLKDLSPSSPVFVVTQAPLPSTYNDFWAMVWEQQVETLVCLLPLNELKNHVYWPLERGQNMQFGILTITLQSQVEKIYFIEHMISVTHNESKISRVVVHLHFTTWPSSGVPSSLSQLLLFITEVLSYQRQQRSLLRPVVVHCSAGVGRSGMFCLISALVTEMINGHGPLDVAQVAAKINQQRKFLIQDKKQLKFCYDAVLYYAQDLLMKRGILTNKASFDDKLPSSSGHSSHIRHPSEDFILGSGGLAKLQSGIAKMGLSDQLNVTATSVEDLTKIKDIKCDIPIVVKDNLQCELKIDENLPLMKSEQDMKSENEFYEQLEENRIDNEAVTVQAENLGLSSITSLLDPSSFTLDSVASPNKRRITKENFTNPISGLNLLSSDNSDPLNQLDPLWSLKKK